MLGWAGTQPGPEKNEYVSAGGTCRTPPPGLLTKNKDLGRIPSMGHSRLYTSSVMSAGVHIEVFSLALYIFLCIKKTLHYKNLLLPTGSFKMMHLMPYVAFMNSLYP